MTAHPSQRHRGGDVLRRASAFICRHHLASAGGITLAALAFRLIVVIFGADPIPSTFSDAHYYHVVASNLADGRGYTYINGATSFWPPGYPFFLAILYYVAYPGVKVALVANAFAGAVTVFATYLLGRRLWSPSTGLLAAAILAVLPSHIFWSAVLLSEIVFTATFAVALWLVCISVSRDDAAVRWAPVLGFAALLAAGTMIRGQMLVLLPVAALFWWGSGLRRATLARVAAPAVILTLALVSVWSIRNFREFDEPILLSSNAGYNLRIGHNPEAFGRFAFLPEFWPPGEAGNLTPEREVAFNRDGTRRAIRYAAAHPVQELRLSIQKLYWLYRADVDSFIWIESFYETPFPSAEVRLGLIHGISATYYALFVLAALGAPLTLGWREPRRAMLLATIVLWTFVHIIFFGETRFHVPLLPIMALMAVRFVFWLPANWTALRAAATQHAAATT